MMNVAKCCRIMLNNQVVFNCWRMFDPFDRDPNPLSPNSDENEISLYIITTRSNIQMMRIKKVIT